MPSRLLLRLGIVTLIGILAAPPRLNGQCTPQAPIKIVAGDGAATDNFGCAVGISANSVVIGAYRDDHAAGTDAGSAYIFTLSGGLWNQQTKLIATDAAANDQLGYSVAISGDTVVVGAPIDDHASGTHAGSAYVFVRSGVVWTQQAKLTAADGAADDFFGISVALDGNTAVVGAWGDDHPGASVAGSSYVFVRNGDSWAQKAKLAPANLVAGDIFGNSVAISGDRIIVGARSDDHIGEMPAADAGVVYSFIRSGETWTEEQTLTSVDLAGSEQFGWSVAAFADTVVVGALSDSSCSQVGSRTAHAFILSDERWVPNTRLIDPQVSTNTYGASVAISNERIIVGEYSDIPAAGSSAGSAHLFIRSNGEWTLQAPLTAPDAAMNDQFGFAVGIDQDVAVIGAVLDDHAAGTDAGSVYVIDVGCDDDDDGVLNIDDLCPAASPGLPIDVRGRPLRDANNDCLVDGADVQIIVDEMLNQ